MDDRRKKGEFVGALGALLVHVAVKTQAAYL